MKHWKLLAAVCLTGIAIASCNKSSNMESPEAEQAAAANLLHHQDSTSIEKLHRLKRFTSDRRVYTFHYDQHEYIDSVVAKDPDSSSYTYRVAHHGKYIDSSSLWDDGVLISTIKDIRYNHLDQVINYTYQLHVYPSPPRTMELAYNYAGDLTFIRPVQSPLSTSYDSLVYYPDRGLKMIIRNASHGTDITDYINDAGINPLSLIPGTVIFTEESIRERWNNRRNTVRKVGPSPWARVTTYVNEYDSTGRIIQSTASGEERGVLTFTYF